MIFLRIYLLLGLVAHKVIWEMMKREPGAAQAAKEAPKSWIATLAKATKIVILIGISVQTLLPDVLPISSAPFTLRLVGAGVYTAGLVIAILGRISLGRNWADIEHGQVLGNQVVVSKGLYSWVRHPIYVGDLLLLAGLELSLNSWLVLGVALLAPVVLMQAVREEKLLATKLPGYEMYCAQTKRFIPFVV
jgi:protein-S-isoprenylcysteine O-methyltransferase Ste14